LVLELATIWNILLTVIVAPIAWYIKSQSDELKRVQILLNKTREQYVHKNDHKDDIEKVVEHLLRLETKLDSLIAKK
jgi:hypothetical protein|tara:strand:+ start:802 stop:1032 length:231 start_codon:yes stop_codon:yes gene_type:complete